MVENMGSSISSTDTQNAKTLAALLPCRGEKGDNGKIQPMSEDEMNKVDQDFSRWRRQWTDRRKIYKEYAVDLPSWCGMWLSVSAF